MGSVVGFVGQFLGMSLLGTMSIATLPSYPCESLCKLPVAAVQPNSSIREQNNTEDLFRKLNASSLARRSSNSALWSSHLQARERQR